MASQSTLDLISWKILLKTCCPKCLMRHDTIWWWTELSNSRRFRPYLNTDPIFKQLTHYIGLYDLSRKWSSFCYFRNLFENSLNVQRFHDISHILWIFDENTKYEKDNLETAWPLIDLTKQGTGYNDRPSVRVSDGYCVQTITDMNEQ